MYLPYGYRGITTTWNSTQRLEELIAKLLQVLGQLFSDTFANLPGALCFVFRRIHEVLAQPSEWLLNLFYTIVDLTHTHIYWAHIIAWSLFFGPIVVLIPFLLLHELLILIVYNLTYTLHGLSPNSLPDQYEILRLSLLDTRESLFSFVDRTSSVFNKWTAEHMPLMVLRLTGGVLGSILFYAIWVGW